MRSPFPPSRFAGSSIFQSAARPTLSRAVGDKLSAALGQPVVYDNHPGANGIIAYGLGAKAPPDGRTWVILSTPFPLNAALGRKLTYYTLKDSRS